MKMLMKKLTGRSKKPLSTKEKEEIMTVFGTVFIIALTVSSAFSLDIRNKNILAALDQHPTNILKG